MANIQQQQLFQLANAQAQPAAQDAMTPQQKMAMSLMQQPVQTDPNGQYSPLQGLAQIMNGYVAGGMRKPPMKSSVQPAGGTMSPDIADSSTYANYA